MMKFILPMNSPDAGLETVGGKGTSLATLARAGLPVPGGFYITTEAYRRFVVANDLQAKILAAVASTDPENPATLDATSAAICSAFAGARLPDGLAAEITAAYGEVCDRVGKEPRRPAAVAVRSSATAEDLPEASFAGQQETYLNVSGEDALLEAVKKCWASLWTARAIAYRTRQNIAPDSVALAVVVQELVDAQAAGILFTANPMNGRRGEMVINAAWGLGEAVVSGAVTPDTLAISKKDGRVIFRNTAEKAVMTVRTPTGVRERPVSVFLRKKKVLSDAQAAELARYGARIEGLYQAPMDIEWALAKDAFAILQARPITSLPEAPLEWLSPYPEALLARGSFAEFLPDPASPLFATLGLPLAKDASLEMMRNMGITAPNCYLFAVVNGYVYVGMTMKPRVLWQFTLATLKKSKEILTKSQKRWSAAREKYDAVAVRWQNQDEKSLPAVKLVAGLREIFAATADYYSVVQSSVIPAASFSEVTFSWYYGKFVRRQDDPEPAAFIVGLDSKALRAEKALFDLAEWAKQDVGLSAYLTGTPTAEICAAVRARTAAAPAWEAFTTRFESYLNLYGHTVYDLDFSRPLPADDPAPLVEAIKVYLNGGGINPHERQRGAVARRERAQAAILRRLDPLRRKWFLKLLQWTQDSAPYREDGIADLGLGYPPLHRLAGELGRRLAAGGAIAAVEDVYWLEAREVEVLAALLDEGRPLENHEAEIEQRKAQWQVKQRAQPPMTIPEKSWMSGLLVHENPEGSLTLKGLGASTGRVTAPACVIHGPEDFGKMVRGGVLVAVTTTPAWTPLFTLASAVVTDIGGPLSHSSIVAREYGIPAVLATGAGTRRIHDWQMITVDGGAGIVEILKEV